MRGRGINIASLMAAAVLGSLSAGHAVTETLRPGQFPRIGGPSYGGGIGRQRGKARSWSVAQDRRMAKKARNVRRAKARAR